VLRFPDGDDESDDAVGDNPVTLIDGIQTVSFNGNGEMTAQITGAMAVALDTMIGIESEKMAEESGQVLMESTRDLNYLPQAAEPATGNKSIGVFLCSCGGSINTVVDYKTMIKKLSELPGVIRVQEIPQACTEAGARQIAGEVAEWQLDGIVLAACRCCNLEQVCYSCTDRRQMCQQYLNEHLILPHHTVVEFVNIREQCAWIHRDDPKGASRKAMQIVSSGISRARITPPVAVDKRNILPGTLIIGDGLASITAARALASRGYRTELVVRQGSESLEQLPEVNLTIRSWPDALEVNGTPGKYEIVLKYNSQVDSVNVGAVLIDTEQLLSGQIPAYDLADNGGLMGRVLARIGDSNLPDSIGNNLRRELTITETAGMFLLSADGNGSPGERVRQGLAAAARVISFLNQQVITPRTMAVNIDHNMCRGCGNCSEICPVIEMKKTEDDVATACIDKTLCFGCGACISSCPTGAITQSQQSDKQIVDTLRAMLRPG